MIARNRIATVAAVVTCLGLASSQQLAAQPIPAGAPQVTPGQPQPLVLTFPAATLDGPTAVQLAITDVPALAGDRARVLPYELAMDATIAWRPDEQTRAVWEEPAVICLHYAGIDFSDPAALRLLHHNGIEWVDLTTRHDVATRTICATVAPSPPLQVLSLSPDRTAPQPPGTPITLTATGAGGTAPYEYQWSVFTDEWRLLQEWSTDPTTTWTPTTAADTRLRVWARSAGSTSDAPDGQYASKTLSFPIVDLPGQLVVTVRDEADATPIPGVEVQIGDANETVVNTVMTDADGLAMSAPLPPGTYLLRARGAAVGYSDARYPDVECSPGSPCNRGASLEVEADTSTPATLELARLGSIEGTVSDQTGAAALEKARVTIVDATGAPVQTLDTDATGRYAAMLAPGAYMLIADGANQFLREAYDNHLCESRTGLCSGTPVHVASGVTTTIDFHLLPRQPTGVGGLAGTIRDAVTGAGLDGITVDVIDAAGVVRTSAVTAGGQFLTSDLPTGVYSIRTTNRLGYRDTVRGQLSYAAGQRPTYDYLDFSLEPDQTPP